MEDLLAHRPLGVISVGTELSPVLQEALDTHTIPLVIVDAAGEPVHDTPSVGAANWSGGYTATRHLLELGHRRIAAVSGPLNVLCARARLDGYKTAMDTAGIPTDGLVRHGEFLVEDGHAQAAELLSLTHPPTAVVTGNDLQALGVYQAAIERGLRVPQDLSVVGFDDHPVAGWVSPQLTTVRQPVLEMAVDATEMLVRLANGDPPRDTRVELATHLVVRQSTAAPSA
jgi:DNA-binding LacI/PurR family transcriptional regulator